MSGTAQLSTSLSDSPSAETVALDREPSGRLVPTPEASALGSLVTSTADTPPEIGSWVTSPQELDAVDVADGFCLRRTSGRP